VTVEDVVDVHHRRHMDHHDREDSLGLPFRTDEAYGEGSPCGTLGGPRLASLVISAISAGSWSMDDEKARGSGLGRGRRGPTSFLFVDSLSIGRVG
jgi:hypothetical protein